MKNKPIFVLRSLVVFSLLLLGAVCAVPAQGVRFRVKIDPALVKEPVSGRLLIFMTNSQKPLDAIEPDFTNPNAVYISGTEIRNLAADRPVEIDADALSFPQKFSAAAPGEYQLMALLDRDHSYTYDGAGAGDLYSKVAKVAMPAATTEIVLTGQIPTRGVNPVKNVEVVEYESPTLSAFWGRPIRMEASVVLPPDYDESKSAKYPTVYSIHGYGGDHLKALRGAADLQKQMAEKKRPEMIYVYLNAHCPLGHHVFADSANNGPWGTALVNDFIPYLEKRFRMDARPSGRFLTGHSSGGWSSLWVMISHPDFFGGTWSTSPDPVDFRSFTGPDLTKYPPQNAYFGDDKKDYNLVRFNGMPVMSVRQYAQQEAVLGYYGGQFSSFEAVFSPKGDDGQPMRIFDRETGVIDQAVAKSWEKYDISRLLRENWATLGPKLKGKLHIWVGTADTFHLDEAVRLLDAELKKLGSDAKIEYLEGRSHFDMYKDGLGDRIAAEMYAVARPASKAAKK
ncbi:MAG: enterochelin esterase [Acidobacteria bacterium]|nr:enterochelin esterase [Acidobacteriota bacterium]